MEIRVFGEASKCKGALKLIKRTVRELGIEAKVEHIEDYSRMCDLGLLMTPAIMVDGRLVLEGRTPTKEELVRVFR